MVTNTKKLVPLFSVENQRCWIPITSPQGASGRGCEALRGRPPLRRRAFRAARVEQCCFVALLYRVRMTLARLNLHQGALRRQGPVLEGPRRTPPWPRLREQLNLVSAKSENRDTETTPIIF
jgi:hypothetical protein